MEAMEGDPAIGQPSTFQAGNALEVECCGNAMQAGRAMADIRIFGPERLNFTINRPAGVIFAAIFTRSGRRVWALARLLQRPRLGIPRSMRAVLRTRPHSHARTKERGRVAAGDRPPSGPVAGKVEAASRRWFGAKSGSTPLPRKGTERTGNREMRPSGILRRSGFNAAGL